jgi:hypothetical protein
MGVIVRDDRLRHGVVGEASRMWAAIAHLSEMIGKIGPVVACVTRSGSPRLRVAGVPVREQVSKNDGQNAG